jgi:thioredoxin-like negative regulator of GroEL
MWNALLIAIAFVFSAMPAEQSSEANQHYQDGRRALDASRWEEAIRAFERASEDEALTDAATYWQAYAYHKLGDPSRALSLIEGMEQQFPESQWLDDARALALEIRGNRTDDALDEDEELKVIALNGLLQTDEEEALPLLEELLSNDASNQMKGRALFVLAQSDSDKAMEILAATARNGSDPELQKQAIHYLGVHRSEGNLELLSSLYEGAGLSPELRRVILESYMIGGDTERLLAVARDASESIELRKMAIHFLGASGVDPNRLLELYPSQGISAELKTQILHGLFVSGSIPELIALARGEKDPELKKRAVHWISMSGTPEAKQFLMELVRSN